MTNTNTKSDSAVTVGGRLRRARQAAKLSQEDAAKALGGTRQMVAAWESGRTQPRASRLQQLCAVYGCDAQDILFGARRDLAPREPGILARILCVDGVPDPVYPAILSRS